jgi:hypothetical protein
MLLHARITEAVIGAAIEVHKTLGQGCGRMLMRSVSATSLARAELDAIAKSIYPYGTRE